MFEAVGEAKAGKITMDELKTYEELACRRAGSCNGMFTANTMACITEAMGLCCLAQRHTGEDARAYEWQEHPAASQSNS